MKRYHDGSETWNIELSGKEINVLRKIIEDLKKSEAYENVEMGDNDQWEYEITISKRLTESEAQYIQDISRLI